MYGISKTKVLITLPNASILASMLLSALWNDQDLSFNTDEILHVGPVIN